jgi:DNA-binding transcriptional ArsR family regulator
MAVPKWTDERTDTLTNFVGDESPVSQATVAEAAEQLETSTRSVSSKLRKMGFEVEPAASGSSRAFSADEEETLREFVVNNSGEYTYGEIAETFAGGSYSAKSVQGKILSMELTEHVRPTEKPVSTKTYTDEEEATFLAMVQDGAYVEDIADALGRPVNSIRGKALSLLRSKQIEAIPSQRDLKGSTADPLEALGDLSELTVDQIAEEIGKTVRGVKTMITRRGLQVADYPTKKEAAN